MTQPTTTFARAAAQSSAAGPTPEATRRLLACAAAAGPLFAVVALIQIVTRPGFNLTRNALSELTNGTGGWVQSANFIATGVLLIAGAMGVRRVLRGGTGGRWAAILMGITGVGLTGGGIFHPDPSNGFPPGASLGNTAVSSWHGVLHLAFGSCAFLALSVLCFVLARRYARSGQRPWAVCSRGAGVVCAAGILSGGAPAGTLTLFLGVTIALLWLAVVSARLSSEPRSAGAVTADVLSRTRSG